MAMFSSVGTDSPDPVPENVLSVPWIRQRFLCSLPNQIHSLVLIIIVIIIFFFKDNAEEGFTASGRISEIFTCQERENLTETILILRLKKIPLNGMCVVFLVGITLVDFFGAAFLIVLLDCLPIGYLLSMMVVVFSFCQFGSQDLYDDDVFRWSLRQQSNRGLWLGCQTA
jgi:hypothetical protein